MRPSQLQSTHMNKRNTKKNMKTPSKTFFDERECCSQGVPCRDPVDVDEAVTGVVIAPHTRRVRQSVSQSVNPVPVNQDSISPLQVEGTISSGFCSLTGLVVFE